MVDSLNGLNPVIVIPAIVKLPLQYLAILILIGGLILIRGILNLLCGGLPFLWRLACYVPLEFLAFYSLIVSARLLGLLYKSNSARLGWFEELAERQHAVPQPHVECMRLAGSPTLGATARVLQDQLPRGDVPQLDSILDVSVVPAARHVHHLQRRRAHQPELAHLVDHLSEVLKAAINR